MLTARLNTQQPNSSRAILNGNYGGQKAGASSKNMLDAVKDAAQLLGEMVMAERKEYPLGDDDIKMERFQYGEDDLTRLAPHEFAKMQRRRGRPPVAKTYAEHEAVHGENGEKWPPKPFPPARSKAQIMETVNFREVDNAVKGKLPLADDGFEEFAQRLTKSYPAAIYKVRAIYVWLATLDFKAIEQDETKTEPDSLLDILHTLREEKMHSSLFHLLCIGAGVPIHMIIGYKKGARHMPGKRLRSPQEMGIWFAVFVEGEWRFVDAHWGCCSDSEQNSINEYYFLTDPNFMIFHHYPLEREWQLLVHPISQDTFEELVSVEPANLIDMGLEISSHPKGVIVIPSYGEADIRFREGGMKHQYETHLLRKDEYYEPYPNYKRRTSITGLQNEETDLNCYVFGQRKHDKLSFTVQLPRPGKYIFLLLGHNNSRDSQRAKMLVQYVIYGFKTRRLVHPLPLVIPVWGVQNLKLGVQAEGLDSSVVQLRRGQGELRLKIVNPQYQDMVFSWKFVLEKTSNSHRRKFCAFHWRSLSGEQVFQIIAFCESQAALVVSDSSNLTHTVAVFCIKSDKSASLPTSLVPRNLPDIFGVCDSERVKQIKFMPKSHNYPIIITDQGSLEIVWTAEGIKNLTFECVLLQLVNTAASDEEQQQEEQQRQPQTATFQCAYDHFVWTTHVEICESGLYKASVVELTVKSRKKVYKTVFSYVILANLPPPAIPEPEAVPPEPDKESQPIIEPKKEETKPPIEPKSPSPARSKTVLTRNGTSVRSPSDNGDVTPSTASSTPNPKPGTAPTVKPKVSETAPAVTVTTRRSSVSQSTNHSKSTSQNNKSQGSNKTRNSNNQKKSAQDVKKQPQTARNQQISVSTSQNHNHAPAMSDLSSKLLEYHLLIHRAIRQARRRRDRDILSSTITKVRETSELTVQEMERLQQDLREAEELRARMDRAEKLCARIMSINNRALGELRSYNRPDPDIHTTVQATLLLLGHYEKRTRKWRRCQPLLKGIIHDIRGYDHLQTHPALAARAAQLLHTVAEDEITLKSAAAAAFYHWSNGVIELLHDLFSKKDFVPAKMEQQRKILNVSDMEEADLEWEDHGSIAKIKRSGIYLTADQR